MESRDCNAPQLRRIAGHLFYLPAGEAPLSADVGLIECPDGWWIYDVGANEASAGLIQSLSGKKRIVLSHFHADHTANLPNLSWDALYAGPYACKKFGVGEWVEQMMRFENGVSVFPLPSSHAKDCLGLAYGEYAFLGDGAYATAKEGRPAYNTGQLQGLIATLRALPVRWFLLSHREPLAVAKPALLDSLQAIYDRRNRQSAYVYLQETDNDNF